MPVLFFRNERMTLPYRFGQTTYDLFSRTYIMGILNVTPDSFSDGGKFTDVETAVSHALRMADEGADFIDVGGESTRPGAESVTIEEELRRVIPVIQQLAEQCPVPISIDTHKPEVAEKALEAGAVIVNDITGLHGGTTLADITARHGASIILMHMKGTPKNMQDHPSYADIMAEILSFLGEGITTAKDAGIKQIIVDPGIGFGKLLQHNLQIFREMRQLHQLRYPVLIGPSRKSFIGKITGALPDQRMEGTAAAVAVSIINGANIIRVHDVKHMKQVAQVTDAIVYPSIYS
jgi:dihydropteroate synthase